VPIAELSECRGVSATVAAQNDAVDSCGLVTLDLGSTMASVLEHHRDRISTLVYHGLRIQNRFFDELQMHLRTVTKVTKATVAGLRQLLIRLLGANRVGDASAALHADVEPKAPLSFE
jgi:hypothetical protein